MTKVSITAIILTHNEELHLKRCLNNVKAFCERVIVVDSYSTDNTESIARSENVEFVQNKWINYSYQFNWALDNVPINSEWVLRIDADEYFTNNLIQELRTRLPKLSKEITGIYVKRLMYFMDMPLKKGGMYPIWHIKLWRNGYGYCEHRWMDERVILRSGKTIEFGKGDLIDHNLNNMTWWTNKHNQYTIREAIDILDGIYNFTNADRLKPKLLGNQEQRKRWLKLKYLSFPLFIRPFIYWFIRYFILGGFLEGKRGFIWNCLHAFWYRYLVDVKIYEVLRETKKNRSKIIEYFHLEYGYDITKY
ncbi:glycosyltransferase family 2 protein [Robiginitalea biformata]|uniref:SpsA-like protein n=1 Tax=Robiginitalea biformata (strain ATCC BAA-864 / DSM 15991 / KCTC 12146 / HTCC2501) TaxID=313596 RepID=A4CP28_ROBBH|nr:glycosyltransferase family 2 protein [Robiginitalea biformata]EAR14645.1 spsA-like protein [Robiginitalea biformata HTCC2501]